MTEASDRSYSPATLMAHLGERFVIASEQQTPLLLKGLFQDKRRGSHRGYFYDRLKDPVSGQVVTLRLPETIKPQLQEGGLYLFAGHLDRDVRHDGVIEPIFVVTDLVEALALEADAAAAERMEVLRQKQALGYRDVGARLKAQLEVGERPQIACISGATSKALEDLAGGLADAQTAFRLVEERTNLLRKEAIVDTLRRNGRGERFDALAILRASGVGVEILDNVAIAQAALAVEVPLLTAITHEQRTPTLLEAVADQSFTGPAALGAYLRELAVEATSDLSLDRSMDAGEAAFLAEEATLRAQAAANVEERYRDRLRYTQRAFLVTTLLLLLLVVALLLQ